jgi:ankyrin repeat protein
MTEAFYFIFPFLSLSNCPHSDTLADLYTAAKENNAEKVLELLEMEVPPLHANKSIGWTALHWASFHGNVQMTRDLLQKGASEPYHRALKKAGLVDVKVVKKKNERRDAKNADGEINANQQEEVDQEEEEEDENGVGFELPEHLVVSSPTSNSNPKPNPTCMTYLHLHIFSYLSMHGSKTDMPPPPPFSLKQGYELSHKHATAVDGVQEPTRRDVAASRRRILAE